MLQLVQLLRDCRNPFGIGRAEHIDGNSSGKIDIFFSCFILQHRALAADQLYRKAGVGMRDIFLIQCFNIHKKSPALCAVDGTTGHLFGKADRACLCRYQM